MGFAMLTKNAMPYFRRGRASPGYFGYSPIWPMPYFRRGRALLTCFCCNPIPSAPYFRRGRVSLIRLCCSTIPSMLCFWRDRVLPIGYMCNTQYVQLRILGQVEFCQLILATVQFCQCLVSGKVERLYPVPTTVQCVQCCIFGEVERSQIIPVACEFSEVFEVFDARERFDQGRVGCFCVDVDSEYGICLFAADFPVPIRVESAEHISAKNRIRNCASVPKNRGIRGSLPVLAGNGRDGIRKNHQCCNGG